MTENNHQSSIKSQLLIKSQEVEKVLQEKNPKLFDGIPKNKKDEIIRSVMCYTSETTVWSGPLPEPDSLAKYNDVINDGANRIMIMAEKQQEHRFGLENKVVKFQSNQSLVGQIFGFVIGLVTISGGILLAMNHETVVGSILVGGTVVSLVSIFVIGKRVQQKSLDS